MRRRVTRAWPERREALVSRSQARLNSEDDAKRSYRPAIEMDEKRLR